MDVNRFRGEWIAFWLCVLLTAFAVFMFVMAVVVTMNPNIAHAEHTTTWKAWYASFVAILLAKFSVKLLNRHLDRKLARLKEE